MAPPIEESQDEIRLDPVSARLHERMAELQQQAEVELADKIITVMSPKGGQGKSTISKELSWILALILVDLDWDGGRVSRLLGYNPDLYKTSPLLKALSDPEGRAPRLVNMKNRPTMIPGHRDFEPNQPTADGMTSHLLNWFNQYKRGGIIDTHPGGSQSTLGAVQAADLIVMPVVLGTGELDAVEETLDKDDLGSFPVLMVPNITPANKAHLPAAESRRLLALARTYGVDIAETFISKHSWMTIRQRRTVIASSRRFGANPAAVTGEMIELAQEVMVRAA